MRMQNFMSRPMHRLFIAATLSHLYNQVMAFSIPSSQISPQSESSSTLTSGPYANPALFQAYEQSMQEVLDKFKVTTKKDNDEDLEAAKQYLFSSHQFVRITSSPNTNDDEFSDYINSQCDLFMEKTEVNQNQKEIISRALFYVGDYCAKRGCSEPLHVAWDKIKEAGLRPKQNALGAFLYTLSSSSASISDYPNGETSSTDSYNPSNIVREVATYHDKLYKPTENTLSIRIKSLVEQGEAAEADKLLWNFEESSANANADAPNEKSSKMEKKKKKGSDNNRLRLRTCVPVLKLYCEEGDMASGLKLYQKMRSTPSVHFESETYALILSSLARRGYFCGDDDNSAEPIKCYEELGYEAGKGAKLFDAIASEMADDVLEITSASAKEIRNSLVAGFRDSPWARNLYEVPYDCDLAAVSNEAADDEVVANRVKIENNSTVCPKTKAELRLILLDEDQRERVHDTLLEMADSQFDAYETKLQSKGNKPSSFEENYAAKHLEGFAKWLETRTGSPFTAIVDGANVAYYGLGNVNYHQVKQMVIALEKMGETPLVIMPQKYTKKTFYLRRNYIQELPQDQMDIIKDLDDAGKFYRVPVRCLDDYYWMLSSVSNQTTSRDGIDLDVSPDDENSRWVGTRPMLLTNDQMRDHKLELLQPRLFRRWVSSHIVNYHIPPYLNDASEKREISFIPADFTSREIQGNPSNDAMAWHFPVEDWDQTDRFCVRIPK